jgi:hypothetical protein
LEMPNKTDSDNVLFEMYLFGNYEEFSCIDNSLQCYKGWIKSSGNTAVTWKMCVRWH